ncbi:unnamed protein product [Discula destructiva]
MASDLSPPRSSCVHTALEHIRNLDWTSAPPSQDYPPISSLPRTSPERLSAASPNKADHLDSPTLLSSSSPTAAPYLSATDTVLYLAYGSNLSAETFLGRRGIRPVSAVNVSVLTLRLTFDLPGIAYKEPCFANVAPRQIPKPPKLPPGLPDPPALPQPPPPGYAFPPPLPQQAALDAGAADVAAKKEEERTAAHGDPSWDGGLIGVVYEVTPEDYATIVQTEGGGAAYKDVLVPCLAIPSRPPGIPERPPAPELPKPFWAHTLYAPRIPTKPGDGDGDGDEDNDGRGALDDDDDDDDDDDGGCQSPIDRLKDWWKKMLLSPIRPDPEYAQPSARYLKLIVDGAAEHELPIEYQRWLRSLQPYTITSRLQAIGRCLFLTLVAPLMLLYLGLGRMLSDENGQVPVWFGLLMETIFHLEWRVYDRVFNPVFGDGERTVDEDGDAARSWRGKSWSAKRELGTDEEKASFLNEKRLCYDETTVGHRG